MLFLIVDNSRFNVRLIHVCFDMKVATCSSLVEQVFFQSFSEKHEFEHNFTCFCNLLQSWSLILLADFRQSLTNYQIVGSFRFGPGFLPGILSFFSRMGESRIYCCANFYCYANFSVVFRPNFGGGEIVSEGDCFRRKKKARVNKSN